MSFHSIDAFERILRETPPAARYLDLHWSIARTFADWRDIRTRMFGAEIAARHLDSDAADDYALLRDIAAIHAENAIRVNGVLAMVQINREAA